MDPEGKPAVTHFTVLRRFADATLVEAVLETGRTHQIRVHAAANGTPILGTRNMAARRLIARYGNWGCGVCSCMRVASIHLAGRSQKFCRRGTPAGRTADGPRGAGDA